VECDEEPVDRFLKLDFSPEAKRKYRWDNCARLCGWEPRAIYARSGTARPERGPSGTYMDSPLRQIPLPLRPPVPI